jgi:hypothetical protein
MGHRFDASSKSLIEQSLASIAKSGRQTNPEMIRVSTTTLKYNSTHAAKIDALIEHWKPAYLTVWFKESGSGGSREPQIQISTENVSAFSIEYLAEHLPPFARRYIHERQPMVNGITVTVLRTEDLRKSADFGSVVKVESLAPAKPLSDDSIRFRIVWLAKRPCAEWPPQTPQPPGPDRRCLHGFLHLRSPDRNGGKRSCRQVGGG